GWFVLKIARCITLPSGALRWEIQAPYKSRGCRCVAVRLKQDDSIQDYVLLPPLPPKRLLRLGNDSFQAVHQPFLTLREVVEATAAEAIASKQPRKQTR